MGFYTLDYSQLLKLSLELISNLRQSINYINLGDQKRTLGYLALEGTQVT